MTKPIGMLNIPIIIDGLTFISDRDLRLLGDIQLLSNYLLSTDWYYNISRKTWYSKENFNHPLNSKGLVTEEDQVIIDETI